MTKARILALGLALTSGSVVAIALFDTGNAIDKTTVRAISLIIFRGNCIGQQR